MGYQLLFQLTNSFLVYAWTKWMDVPLVPHEGPDSILYTVQRVELIDKSIS
jgi:hypothetical protein